MFEFTDTQGRTRAYNPNRIDHIEMLPWSEELKKENAPNRVYLIPNGYVDTHEKYESLKWEWRQAMRELYTESGV